MRKFNLEDALNGAKLITREGNPARIIASDIKDDNYPIAVAIQYTYGESVINVTKYGNEIADETSNNDIMIDENPRTLSEVPDGYYYEHTEYLCVDKDVLKEFINTYKQSKENSIMNAINASDKVAVRLRW